MDIISDENLEQEEYEYMFHVHQHESQNQGKNQQQHQHQSQQQQEGKSDCDCTDGNDDDNGKTQYSMNHTKSYLPDSQTKCHGEFALPPIPRLVQRNLPYHQSLNRIHIENYYDGKGETSFWDLFRLHRSDWFHILLRMPSYYSLLLFLTIWTIAVMVWGVVYVLVDRIQPTVDCGLGKAGEPIFYYAAFAFSLETCTTVGYGLPSGVNSFFESCPEIQIAIYFQMVWSMLFNAFLLTFFYSSLARANSRAQQVVFGNKAIVSIHNAGTPEAQVRFQVRVYDIDCTSHIIESHIRMYAVRKDRPVPQQLRLSQPDDELDAMMFLSIPTVACHQIDLYSILHPPLGHRKEVRDGHCRTGCDEFQFLRPYLTSTDGLNALRQSDSLTGNRDGVVCPICGESYGTVERWILHLRNFQAQEAVANYPVPGTHRSVPDHVVSDALVRLKPTLDLELLREYFQSEISEIIVVVEGIEPTCSGTFGALQSYQYEDIIFRPTARFGDCIRSSSSMSSPKSSSPIMMVDLDQFHNIDFRDPSTEK